MFVGHSLLADQISYSATRLWYIMAMKKFDIDTATLAQRAVIVRYKVMQRNPKKYAQTQKMAAQSRIDLDRKSRILRGQEPEVMETTPKQP